ncbi:helix-turn-helix transcriptional regulator [Pedobacter psychrodurus]|uniref:helix-turn-helix domain-containing protein n=1 Tax=Pedobacter psychrodurus TaxID=2530456 RepID=UPI002930B086|nr:helix-turn-helix transcriptional regulator [Pedobacter psychrodurus]
MEENDFVSIWLEETGNPAIEKLTEMNQQLAAKTAKTQAEKGLSDLDLATLLDINPDEIKRWLIGKHPFSAKVLSAVAAAINDVPKPEFS